MRNVQARANHEWVEFIGTMPCTIFSMEASSRMGRGMAWYPDGGTCLRSVPEILVITAPCTMDLSRYSSNLSGFWAATRAREIETKRSWRCRAKNLRRQRQIDMGW